MTLEVFLFLLFIDVTFTGFITEAIKSNKKVQREDYCSNVIAGVTAVILSALIWIAYIILMETPIDLKMVVYLVAFMICSWLGAMLGYDKISQTILQIAHVAPKRKKIKEG